MPVGCGAFDFVAAFTPHHEDIDPAPAFLTVRIPMPKAGSRRCGLCSPRAVGTLLANLNFSAGSFEHLLPHGWRWNTTTEIHLHVFRASVSFTRPG